MRKRLAIVGAGPKAAAIAARAAVLRDVLGKEKVPELIILEQDCVASAWGGRGKYSSGFITLCTPGEKDVGFPYADTAAFGPTGSIAPLLHSRFSWGAYLVETGRIADWVDAHARARRARARAGHGQSRMSWPDGGEGPGRLRRVTHVLTKACAFDEA